MVAGFMALFGGLTGMHKFYLGYTRAGLAMLTVSLACGVFGAGYLAIPVAVIGLFEGIIYLRLSEDDFVRTHVLGRRPWF